jgi:PAS domain S-box-containing protein
MEREAFFDYLYSPARDKEEVVRELSAVMEIAGVINSRLDLDHILSRISVELAKVIDYDIGCVAIYEKAEQCLYIRHVHRRNGDTASEGRYVPLDESNLIGWVAINRKPILRRDIAADQRFVEIMKEDNLGSDIVVPLIAKDTLIGTLNIGSYRAGRFTEFDLDLVTNLSHLTTIAIENSQLVDGQRELGDKYRQLMRHASDLILLIDVSGRVVECNHVMQRKFGYRQEEVLGKDVWIFTTPERRDLMRSNFATTLKGGLESSTEIPCLKRDGEIIYLDMSTTVLKVNGHPYVLAVGHDVTERKILEEKITIQNRDLKELNRKLMELDRLKSEFLGRISHELRTPLSVIMAYTGTLKEDDGEIDQATRREFLDVIGEHSNKLLQAINDLLDLSKVEISETMLNITEASINEIVRLSTKLVEPYAVQRGVTIDLRLEESIPVTRFDPLRIRQVCVNLLNNAVKFSPRGGTITVVSRLAEREIVVSVRDEGPGIAGKDVKEIFDNFTQVNGGSTRSTNGMGIGLRLVKHYVSLHRGMVWVDSETGRGSIFWFSLPFSPCREVTESTVTL